MTAAPTRSERAVVFRVGETAVELAAVDVAEIVRRPRTIRVPHGPSQLVGLASLRGVATPIFSLAGLLGQPDGGSNAWIVVLNRDPVLGLLVDRVETICESGEAAPGTLSIDDGGKRRSVALAALLAGQSAALRKAAAQRPDLHEGALARREEASVGLLSFTIAGHNYALPLADIVEVASLPKRVKAGRDASLGKAVIRGRKVDLVSLRALLGLGHAAATGDVQNSGNERVIVVDVGGKSVGLVVDGARTILRAPEASVGAPPALLNREDDAARIQSVVRMPDGRSVVSVLTVASLFQGDVGQKEEKTFRVPEQARGVEEAQRFVIFRIGAEHYGYPIEAVGEIVRSPETIIRVPGAPSYVAGATNLRGTVMPVLDQRQRFGVLSTEDGRDGRILVVNVGGMRTGLLVDGVTDIRRIETGRIGAAPELSGPSSRLFNRVIMARQNEDMILVVDPDMLLSRAEADQLAAIGGKISREAATETVRL